MIERIDLGVRVAGDKALKADEFVTLSQLSGASTLPNGDIDFTTGSITRYEIIGDAVTTVFTLTHELGKDIIHEAYLDATGETVMLGLFLRTSDTDITIDTSPFILKVAEKLIVLVASALGGNETGGGSLPDGTETGTTLFWNGTDWVENKKVMSVPYGADGDLAVRYNDLYTHSVSLFAKNGRAGILGQTGTYSSFRLGYASVNEIFDIYVLGSRIHSVKTNGRIFSSALAANTVLMANASKEIVSASGATGTFTTADSKTVTVTNGLITSIV